MMDIIIRKMETDDEIKGKAYVHWKSWHESYSGIVDPAYLKKLTLEQCEQIAYQWPENILVAKDRIQVVGFLGCGENRELAECGEIFALYVLPEYQNKGIGSRLMQSGMEKLKKYPERCLWVLEDNQNAIRFYKKFGFSPDGAKRQITALSAAAIRLRWDHTVSAEG